MLANDNQSLHVEESNPERLLKRMSPVGILRSNLKRRPTVFVFKDLKRELRPDGSPKNHRGRIDGAVSSVSSSHCKIESASVTSKLDMETITIQLYEYNALKIQPENCERVNVYLEFI